MFLRIPLEVLEQIMDSADEQDKWNLAKTSRQHYKVLKPLLWKSLELTTEHLVCDYVDPLMLENMQYTQELYVDVKLNPAVPQDFMRYGFNVSSLLNALNPAKLNSLTLQGACGERLLLSVKDMHFLQYLELRNLVKMERTTLTNVILPPTLKKLKVHLCPVSDEFIQAVVRNCTRLESLEMFGCMKLTSQSLVTITEAKNLSCLGLHSFGPLGHKFDISCLTVLPYLVELRLAFIGIVPGSFTKLIEGLPNLEVLQIANMKVTDEEFSTVGQLKSITALDIGRCRYMKGSSFVATVSSLPALKKVDIDVQMFSENTDQEDLREILSPLNEMESLKSIKIYHDDQKYPGICLRMVSVLCWGDKKMWTVTVDDGVDNNEKILTLHKN